MSKPANAPKEKKEEKKKCFIIGPIGSAGSETRRNADFLLKGIIEYALENTNYELVRADRVSSVGSITTDVVNHIIDSDLIIADLSEHNPNAFYELGIAHSQRKPVIHVCRKGFSIPFDNSHERTVFFDISDWDEIIAARNSLVAMVNCIAEPNFTVSNPYTVATDLKKLAAGDDKEQQIAELSRENEKLTIENENLEANLRRTSVNQTRQASNEDILRQVMAISGARKFYTDAVDGKVSASDKSTSNPVWWTVKNEKNAD